MGRKISKIIAILFVLVTTLGEAVTGIAANENVRPESGSLTIHKHWAEVDGIGDEGNGESTTIDLDKNPAISGIQFDVYELTPKNGAPKTPPSDKDGWKYSRTNLVLTVSKDGESSLTYDLVKKVADSVGDLDGKTDKDGALKYTDLPAGFYYVEENLAESKDHVVQGAGNSQKKVMFGAKAFVVAVPMTNPSGDGWNTDVHVYPKNQGSNFEKVPEKPSVTVGDTVKWTISADVPANFSNYAKFDIVDELDPRLNYMDGTVVVTALDEDTGNEVLLLTNDYTVTHVAAAGSEKEKLTITLTKSGIENVAVGKYKKISVSFDTVVNGNIDHDKTDDEENIIENDAKIEFDNGSGSTGEVETPPAKIHTGEIKINKTYSGEAAVNKSAQFQLADTAENAKNKKYLQVVLDSTNTYIEKIVPAGTENAVDWVVLPSYADTGEALGFRDGKFYASSFEGLQTYTEADSVKTYNSYYLVETFAPDGYNLLNEALEVKFADGVDEHTVHTEAIENKKGFTLPNTGGVGTILLVVFGIIMIGLAILLTMNRKKKAV